MSIETQKMELRSTLKALNFKRSRVACRIHETLNEPGEFFIDQLDLNDPRVKQSDKELLMDLNSKIYRNTWKLDKLDNINEPERHHARQLVFDIISLMTLEESIEFLKKYNCSNTLELVDKLIQNPNLLEVEI